MKLILDAHHSRHAAEQLRAAGHDVIAAADDPMLAVLTDEELLTWSTKEERAIVTENARDFDRIARALDCGRGITTAASSSPRPGASTAAARRIPPISSRR